MALIGGNKGDKKKSANGLLRLRNMAEKLRRSFSLPKIASSMSFQDDLKRNSSSLSHGSPEDAKKGHFAVIAIDNGNTKRFVVSLCLLNNPLFLRLLERAAEEFGFEHEGALCIPCPWNELETMLGLDRY